MTTELNIPEISASPSFVDLVMIHASQYPKPVLGPGGKALTKKVMYHGAEIEVPATEPVYLYPSGNEVVSVPAQYAEIMIANGSARYPTQTVVIEPKAVGPATTPTTDIKQTTAKPAA